MSDDSESVEKVSVAGSIRVDEEKVHSHVDELVRTTVQETLNQLGRRSLSGAAV